jgi:hypothetical protein
MENDFGHAVTPLDFACHTQNARHGRHAGRKSQEEPSVMVAAILATIRVTSLTEMVQRSLVVAQPFETSPTYSS